MLNTSREISHMIFPLDQDTIFGEVMLKAGFNTIKRINNEYQVTHISNMSEVYTVLPYEQMHKLLTFIYKGTVEGGLLEDDGDFIYNNSSLESHKIQSNVKKVKFR